MTDTEPDQDDIVVTDHILSTEVDFHDSSAMWVFRWAVVIALLLMAVGMWVIGNRVADVVDDLRSNARVIVQCEIPEELGA